MSKIEDINKTGGAPLSVRPLGTLDTLENLAGFVDDLNNQTISRLSDPEALKTAVKQRFGPDVSVQDAMDAMDALRDLSTHA